MAFKLRSGKTPTTYMEGTAPNKLAKEKAVAKMKEAAAAKKKMEDGRAGSSAFQQKSAEEGKKLRTYLAKVEAFLDEGFSQKEAEQMVKSGADLSKNKKSKDNKDVVASKDKKSSPNKQKDQGDFEPAYPGADYSKEQIAKMSKKEKEQKIDGYDPKLDGVKKGKIIYKDGKKFYQASDGSLHTGQVEDYERELKADKEMKKKNRPEPTYEGTDEFRKEKDIPKKEFKKRGVKRSPNKQAKPDFLDLDGDGDKTESMKKAAADKKGSPSKQTEKQKKNLPPNLVKEIAKAKGNASPTKQKSRLLPSENPDTYVYDGNLYVEKVNDLEDRISFIKEDMFNETGDSVQQKKDIATLQKQLKKLKANKPKNKK